MLSRSRLRLLPLLAATSLALPACGSGAEDSADRGTGGIAGSLGAGGQVGVGGSGGQGGSVSSSAVSIVFVHGENLYGGLAERLGETRKLSDIEDSEDQLEEFQVSPDGRFVAYLASRRDPTCCGQELMVASLDVASEPNRADDAQGKVADDFRWSPDGSRLAYRAHEDEHASRWDWRIYTVSPDGRDETQASADGIDVSHQPGFEIAWSPNGLRIAYFGYDRSLLRHVLETNAWSGESARQIAERPGSDFAWRRDGVMLAYTTRNSEGGVTLFTSDAMGASEAQISNRLGRAGGGFRSFAWSPDGSRIAYLTEGDQGVVELYSRAADGSDERRMTGELQEYGVTRFTWSFDGSRIAYVAWQDRQEDRDLYTTEADGSNNKRISSSPNDLSIATFQWSPTGDWIAFAADDIEDRDCSVFVSSGDGSERYKLNLPGREAGLYDREEATSWSPDGEYLAFFEENEIRHGTLVASRLDGTDRHAVYDELEFRGRGVTGIQWSPDSTRIAYRADRDAPNLFELYTAKRDGSDNLKVSIPGVEVAHEFQWVP